MKSRIVTLEELEAAYKLLREAQDRKTAALKYLDRIHTDFHNLTKRTSQKVLSEFMRGDNFKYL